MRTYKVFEPESGYRQLLTRQVTIIQAGPHHHDSAINKEVLQCNKQVLFCATVPKGNLSDPNEDKQIAE